MKQKKGNFKKSVIAVMSSVCVLTSLTAVDVMAATATRTGITNEGYRVSSSVSYVGNSVTGWGEVLSGPPCSIQVNVRGYSNIKGIVSVSCSIKEKLAYGQSFTKSTSGKYTIVKAQCDSTFNAGYTISAMAQ